VNGSKSIKLIGDMQSSAPIFGWSTLGIAMRENSIG
jgi:hypothetical protein